MEWKSQLRSIFERVILAVLLSAAWVTSAQATPPLVQPEWLMQRLGQSDLKVLDLRAKPEQFTADGHIPGAALWNISDANAPVDVFGRTRNLPSVEDMGTLLRSLGVRQGDTVVLTSNASSAPEVGFMARAYWLIKYHGYDKVAVLDGGTGHWAARDFPLSKVAATVTPGDVRLSGAGADWLIQSSQMKEAVDGKQLQPVDFRASEFYRGEKKQPFVAKAGHIPGAINQPAGSLFETHAGTHASYPQYLTFKTAAALRELAAFQQQGLPRVAYCDSGVLSGTGFFAMRALLGMNDARYFPGSSQAWAGADLPMMVAVQP
ncbi:MAG: sulfurtransferase [Thiobacillus sp.]